MQEITDPAHSAMLLVAAIIKEGMSGAVRDANFSPQRIVSDPLAR